MWEEETLLPKLVEEATVLQQELLAPGVYRLALKAPQIASQAQPGQFVHVRVAATAAPLLRRPISIAGASEDGTLILIYRIVGEGTKLLSSLVAGDTLDLMGPLGNGFKLEGKQPLLVGGGVGLAPLLFLAQRLCPLPVKIVLGGRCQEDLFWLDLFRGVCSQLIATTDDGSCGLQGTVVAGLPGALKQGVDGVFSCGPEPMMQAVAAWAAQKKLPCQVSLEKHMACGVGACLSCTCADKEGKRRKVCTDGPVFQAEEVFYDA